MKSLRCLLRLHPWQYDFHPITGKAIRGCPRCGKIQIGVHGGWVNWAEGWTWQKWLEYKPELLMRARIRKVPKAGRKATRQDIGKFMAGKGKGQHKWYRRSVKAKKKPEE